ncbi:MAG: Uma2 family endonuclease, partial [Deltaproteobacteria bacterium]|nr:Uma2 family endonuclease [Deltaproteobacteria bacterium]
SEVVEHPSLKDLPFKIETNQWGEIVMTPGTVRHAEYQGLIIEWLVKLKSSGRIFVESGIRTSEGVKVADVAWGSAEFVKRNREEVPYFSESPDIVVEVKSAS